MEKNIFSSLYSFFNSIMIRKGRHQFLAAIHTQYFRSR